MPSAASTQLDSIKLVEGNDTIMLPGFRKDQSEYEYALNGATCPQILAYKSGDQKVTITAPYAAGTAVIKVTSKDGDASSQYTIEFTKTAVATVRLKGIKIDGAFSFKRQRSEAIELIEEFCIDAEYYCRPGGKCQVDGVPHG